MDEIEDLRWKPMVWNPNPKRECEKGVVETAQSTRIYTDENENETGRTEVYKSIKCSQDSQVYITNNPPGWLCVGCPLA